MTKRSILLLALSLLLASSVWTDASACQAAPPDLKDQHECGPIPNSDGEVTTGSITGVSVNGIHITAGSSEASPAPFRVYENGSIMAPASVTEALPATSGDITAELQANSITSAMIVAKQKTIAPDGNTCEPDPGNPPGPTNPGAQNCTLMYFMPQQAPVLPSVPTLTDVQKLVGANVVQRVEIAQLRLTQAVTEAQAVLKEYQRPGFVLDVQTWTYAPQPTAPAVTYAPEKPAEKPAPAKDEE